MKTLIATAASMAALTTSALAHPGHVEHGYISLEHALVLAGLAGVGYLVYKARG